MGCIWLACNSGGPTESVVHEETGYLLDADDPEQWGQKLYDIFYNKSGDNLLDKMKANAKKRVQDVFSFKAFGDNLSSMVQM